LSRWIKKTRTKNFKQTIEQIDPKNQNKELYTDSWADGFKKPEQRALRRLLSRWIQNNQKENERQQTRAWSERRTESRRGVGK
jgi:hypothetical protein